MTGAGPVRKSRMHLCRLLQTAILCPLIFLSACAPKPIVPVELCFESESFSGLDDKVLATALRRSGRWSASHYGKDCYVCAEPSSIDEDTFSLHLTSPIDDILIDTSALLTFRRDDATLVDEAVFHSCHVRVKKDGSKVMTR